MLIYKSGGQVLTEIVYLLQAGRDRIGALDASLESTSCPAIQPGVQTSMADLINATDKVETGQPLPESLANALLHGSSVGGARPKSLLTDKNDKWIAKFSSSRHYPADAHQFFRRMVFNILIDNTDDHARNHAFFCSGMAFITA